VFLYQCRHFTIRGAEGTDFEGGVYHGKILVSIFVPFSEKRALLFRNIFISLFVKKTKIEFLQRTQLPPEYPFKPPHIMFLTPSGRFETNTKVCLSFSAYHPELWQPAWGIRLILEAIISFLPTPADGAVGALDWSSDERKRLAKDSLNFSCAKCGKVVDLLPQLCQAVKEKATENKFAKEIEALHAHQRRNEASSSTNAPKPSSDDAAGTATNDDEDTPAQNQDSPNAQTSDEQQREETALPQNEPLLQPPPIDNTASVPWISDPVIHAIIVTLAAIVFLLYQRMLCIVQELKGLEHS